MDIPIKPIHLSCDELNYELRIRGVVTQKEVVKRQKILQRALEREVNEPITLIDPDFSFETEKINVNATLSSINAVVSKFEGNESDQSYKRIKSRLAHIIGRVLRMPCQTNEKDIQTFKQESYATCLEIEAELADRVKQFNNFNPTTNSTTTQDNSISFQSSSSKSVPVYKWNIMFDGEPNSSLPAFLLDRVDELALARRVDKEELFCSAIDLFSGKTLMWYRLIRNSVSDWDSLVALLKTDFLSENYDDELWDEIRNRQQGKNESVTIFIAQMETLFNRLSKPPVEAIKIKYIRNNLLPYYVRQLALNDISTIADLHKLGKRLETASQTSSRQRVPYKSNYIQTGNNPSDDETPIHPHNDVTQNSNTRTHTNTNKKAITCWNCKQLNHTYQHCTLKRSKFCYKCGKSNVTTSSCPSCSGN